MYVEIEEILNLLKRCDNTYIKIESSNSKENYEYHQVNDLRLDGYHSQLLYNYITSLQKENEELKQDNINGCEKFIKQKQRIDKVLELCEKQFLDYQVDYLGNKTKRYVPIDTNKIVNILGGDEEMKLYCYGKEDITEPTNITREDWDKYLQQLIIGAVRNEEHLGKNLKQKCIDYLEKLFGGGK